MRQPTIAIGILMPWALFGEKALGSFLPNLATYLPFTAGAQLYAVTTKGPPLDPGVGAALFLTWTALLVVVGWCYSSGVTSPDVRRSRTRWTIRAVPSAIVVPSSTPAIASDSQCAPR